MISGDSFGVHHNLISIRSNTKVSRDDEFKWLNDEYVKWRGAKIERHFLSSLPEDWRDWLLSPHIDPELKADFQNELAEDVLLEFQPLSQKAPGWQNSFTIPG